MGNTFSKDPQATLDYVVDWAEWLDEGDSISASSWTVTSGLTIENSPTFTTTRAVVWLSGGTVGERYTATNHIVTASGRADDRTLTIAIAEQ